MRCWELQAFGDGGLALVERPDPVPGRGQIGLAMRAVSLNYRDLLMVRGAYDPRLRLPIVPCSDGVGQVVAVGEGVDRVKLGDRAMPIFAQRWIAGEADSHAVRSTLGGPLDGTLATAMVVDQEAVVVPPAHLTDAECATLPCAGVTAWRALAVEGGVRAGSTVLTLGTGGVSTFALQLGKLLGARVAITSSSQAKLARAAALGADLGVSYVDDTQWGRTVAAWSDGGVDVVVELGGAGTLDQSLRAVRVGGTVALIGVLAGVTTELPLTRVFMRGVRVQGTFVGSRADLEGLCRALAAHPDCRPVVDRVFPMEAAADALDYLASGQHQGKVVVEVEA